MRNPIDIKKPSPAEVLYYLALWDSLENYTLQESSLKKLFTETYPLNNDLDDVLIKVCSLNDFYSTNIFSPFIVAKHIVRLSIDDDLSRGELSIVDKIARVEVTGGKIKYFYSFASKYCSHHRPQIYPIYDSYVDQMLVYFKNTDNFYNFPRTDLKSYARYREILEKFRIFYKLDSFDLKQIDKYLWQAGKKYFPKNYA